MRILMVAARCTPFVGGIETHINEVGSRITALGHDVTVLTTDPTRSLPAEESLSGMRIRRVKAWPKNRDYYFAPGIYTQLLRGRWDIIHFQGYHTLAVPIGMLAAIRRNAPFVLSFHSGGHSSAIRNAVRGVQHALLAPLIARSSKLIAVSEYEATFFSKRMHIRRERIAVVPNGASLPAPRRTPPRTDGHLVMSIGRLERYKGHHRVVAAIPDLIRRVPDARLMIIGSGPYEKRLRSLIRALNLEDHVTILAIGPGERQRLADLLSCARLVVLLSAYEAHPVAIMEALSLRRPTLVSDTSGLRELAQNGFCRSVPLNADASAIADAMAEELLSEPSLPEFALPSWDTCAHELIAIYGSVLQGAHRNSQRRSKGHVGDLGSQHH